MSEAGETLRVGLAIHDAVDLWRRHGHRIVDAPTDQDATDAGRHVYEWSRDGVTGRAELSPEGDSTLVDLTLEGEEAETELDRLLERLSTVLREVGSAEVVSFEIEPAPGAAPDDRTSPDQPL